MPPLPLSGRQAAAIIHSLVPIQPGAVNSLHGEDFLIVQSCVDSASYKKRRRVNPQGQCYSITYSDFELSYRITAEITGYYGLADYHPGCALNDGVLPKFANGVPAFGVKGGVLIYEDPVRTRLPGDLDGISFTVARENCELAWGNTNGGKPSAYSGVPDPLSVSIVSYPPPAPPPSGARYDQIYGVSAIWIRRVQNLLGPVSGTMHFPSPVDFWLTANTTDFPVSPASLAAFKGMPYAGVEDAGNNEFVEVFNTGVAGGVVLLAGAGDISSRLSSGLGPKDPIPWNFFCSGPGGETNVFSSTATTAAQLFEQFGGVAGYIDGNLIEEIYSIHQAAWIYPLP